jgi:hypothetical protein
VPFFHLVPVFGSAMAILFLGEQPRLISSDRISAGAGRRGDRIKAGLGITTPADRRVGKAGDARTRAGSVPTNA